MHVHGLQGKFSQPDEEVIESAQDCYTPLRPTAWTTASCRPSRPASGPAPCPRPGPRSSSDDLLFMSGGGILAHPGGPAAGVASIRQAWEAARAGVALAEHARGAPELAAALAFFGKQAMALNDGALRIAYYGDDFTGATDTLATAARAGLRSLLFLGLPTRRAAGARRPAGLPGHRRRGPRHDARGDARRARTRGPRCSRAWARPCCTTRPARPSTAPRRSAASARPSASCSRMPATPWCPSSAASPTWGATACSATCSPAPGARPCTAWTGTPP